MSLLSLGEGWNLQLIVLRVCIFSLMRLIEFRKFITTDLACKPTPNPICLALFSKEKL